MSRRRCCVLGYWMIFLGVTAFLSTDKLHGLGITLSAAPLYVLAYWNEWKPK